MKIKIIGAGLSGVLTAYHLLKCIPKDNKNIQIEINDKCCEFKENASTLSLAWLNAAYPSYDENEHDRSQYDRYRLEALRSWPSLLDDLKHDGIDGVLESDLEQSIHSLYVFFNQQQENEFIQMSSRLKQYDDHYQASFVPNKDLAKDFTFIDALPKDIRIFNMANERLINPRALISQLITFLKNSGVLFSWETSVTSEMILSEPYTHWIIAAGDGCLPLLNYTKFKDVAFRKQSVAEVIHCDLSSPLNLKRKVFHFETTNSTPGFHLRNDDNNINRLKIIIDYDRNNKDSLNAKALSIFQLLHIQVSQYDCLNTMVRPMTYDGRPLVETELGDKQNIHLIYGHNLYSNAAKIYFDFAKNIAFAINSHHENIFHPVGHTFALKQFSFANRFKKYSISDKPHIRNALFFARLFSHHPYDLSKISLPCVKLNFKG